MSIYIPESIADRRPTTVQLSYIQSTVAPHSTTVRSTYTLPANRLGLLTYGNGIIRRTQIPSVTGRTAITVNYTPVGGVSVSIMRLEVILLAVQSNGQKDTIFNMLLLPGDVVDISTVDGNVGGFHDYVAYAGIVLYDV